ncbi:MAG: hypothetical protein ACLRTA_03645 [Clostridia bacterium]
MNWCYGQDVKNKVITVSYNGIIARSFLTAKDMILRKRQGRNPMYDSFPGAESEVRRQQRHEVES